MPDPFAKPMDDPRTCVQDLLDDVSTGLTSQVARAALALARAYGVADPNAMVHGGGQNGESRVLLSVAAGAAGVFGKGGVEWPRIADGLGREALSFQEQLSLWLLDNGANPWVRDEAGEDVFDVAARSGARTLAQELLLRHDAPGVEVLRRRVGRIMVGHDTHTVPLTHVAVHEGRVGWLRDLISYGWDPTEKDVNGVPLAGWVTSPEMLMECMRLAGSLSLDDAATVRRTWDMRTNAQELSQEGRDALEAALVKHQPETKDTILALRFEQMANTFLSASIGRKDIYAYSGQRERWLWSDRSVGEGTHILVTGWDWRATLGRGRTLGNWSLAGAAIWGCWLGEFQEDASRKLMASLYEAWACLGEEKTEAWLNEKVRPGISNRVLAMLALGFPAAKPKVQNNSFSMPEDCRALFWERLCRGREAEWTQIFEEMVGATQEILGKKPSDSAMKTLRDHWARGLSLHHDKFLDTQSPVTWELLSRMARAGFLSKALAENRLYPLVEKMLAPGHGELHDHDLTQAVANFALASLYTPTSRSQHKYLAGQYRMSGTLFRILMERPEISPPAIKEPYPFSHVRDGAMETIAGGAVEGAPRTASEWRVALERLHLARSVELSGSGKFRRARM